jgi:hypothetical protein
MPVTYPPDCNTPAERTEWLYAAQELLRHVHNIFSYWHRNDVTQDQHDNPPLPDVPDALRPSVRRIFASLKSKYPYRPRLPLAGWDSFYDEEFRPRSDQICTQINIQRRQLKGSTRWSPNVEGI